MKIECLCLVEKGIELYIVRPEYDGCGSNRSQYFICFKGLGDYVDFTPSIAIVGSWEYDSFLKCLSLSTNYIKSGSPNLRKIFNDQDEFAFLLSFEISKKRDCPDKIRFKFTFEQNVPVSVGADWSNKGNHIFAFYVSAEELAKIGTLLERLDHYLNSNIAFDFFLNSSSEYWLIPSQLIEENDYVKKLSILDFAKKEIGNIAKCGVAPIWIEFLERVYSYRLEIVVCPCCDGKFVRKKIYPWKKKCLGCYLDEEPTAIQQSDIDKIEHQSWIK